MKNVYTDTSSEYQAVRGASGLVDYQGIGVVQVGGSDASAFLGGVLTRSVDFLLEGQISSALVLTEQGTLLAEVAVHCQGADYLLEIWPAQAQATIEHLRSAAAGQSGVTVTDVSADYRVLGLEGPEPPQLAQKLLPFPVSSMAYRSFVNADYAGHELLVSRTGVSGEYGYKVHVPVAAAEDVRAELLSLGAAEIGVDALNVCRMEMRFANLEAESGGQPRTPFDALPMAGLANPRHGVRLPYTYLTTADWRGHLGRAGLTIRSWDADLALYPAPLSAVFGRGLHVLIDLEATPSTPTAVGGVGSLV